MAFVTEKGKMIEEFRTILEQHTDEAVKGVVSKLDFSTVPLKDVTKLCSLIGFLSGAMTGGLWNSDLETIEFRLNSLKDMVERY